jgi:hypothetical protein
LNGVRDIQKEGKEGMVGFQKPQVQKKNREPMKVNGRRNHKSKSTTLPIMMKGQRKHKARVLENGVVLRNM